MDFKGAFAALALAVLCVPASGQEIKPGEEGALGQLLAPRDDARACWRRSYSKDHLAGHPLQTVADIEFRLAYKTFGPDDDYPEQLHSYLFQLLVQRRGAEKRLQAGGNCWLERDDRVFCGVECDGGGIFVRQRAEAGRILVSFDEMWGIALSECGEETGEPEAVPLEPGRDDKSFLLARVDDAACPAYADWEGFAR